MSERRSKKRRAAKKLILIAHQSTIPHYRVAFYNAIEQLKPDWWDFSVVFDLDKEKRKRFFQDEVDEEDFYFNIEPVKTFFLHFRGKRLVYQSMVRKAAGYDLLVLDHIVHNLSYLVTFYYRFLGKPVMLWGHGKDYFTTAPTRLKKLAERYKRWMAKTGDGFFSYTEGERKYLVEHGVDEHKVFALNNTIDIMAQRDRFAKLHDSREALRDRESLAGRKVLLYVGRLNRFKRIDFLIEAFNLLYRMDPSHKLVLVGGGKSAFIEQFRSNLPEDSYEYRGVITDPDQLAPLYIASDAYVFPGNVGLSPLQALCYDLTPVVIDGPTHNPEYEYLGPENAMILPAGTSAEQYAEAVETLLNDRSRWAALRACAWASIQHLTIENMARNFIHGINEILGRK